MEHRLGFALCGSFCTLGRAVGEMERLKAAGWDIQPILSPVTYETDTRFGRAEDWIRQIETICQKPVWHTIPEAEPVGPQKLFDVLLVMPCTGNTLAKLAHGVTDTSVTMAVKAHLRNGRPVVLAPATNDGLAASAPNIGTLLARRHIYFVPMRQDDPVKKERSLVSDFTLAQKTLEKALEERQLQPLFLQK